MPTMKLYTVIYVVLFAFATLQVAVEFAGFLESVYWTAFWAIASPSRPASASSATPPAWTSATSRTRTSTTDWSGPAARPRGGSSS